MQVWYKPSLRKGKQYFGSSTPPTASTHLSIWQGFWSVPVSNRSESTLAWGQEGLESWSAREVERRFGSLLGSGSFVGKSLTSCSSRWHPNQGCLHLCPTMNTSRHFLTAFPSSLFTALKVADLHPLPEFCNSSPLWLRQPLFVPSCLLARPIHLSVGLPKPMQTATTVIFFYLFLTSKQIRQSLLQTRELLPVFCAAKGFILTLHETKQMLQHRIWPKS